MTKSLTQRLYIAEKLVGTQAGKIIEVELDLRHQMEEQQLRLKQVGDLRATLRAKETAIVELKLASGKRAATVLEANKNKAFAIEARNTAVGEVSALKAELETLNNERAKHGQELKKTHIQIQGLQQDLAGAVEAKNKNSQELGEAHLLVLELQTSVSFAAQDLASTVEAKTLAEKQRDTAVGEVSALKTELETLNDARAKHGQELGKAQWLVLELQKSLSVTAQDPASTVKIKTLAKKQRDIAADALKLLDVIAGTK